MSNFHLTDARHSAAARSLHIDQTQRNANSFINALLSCTAGHRNRDIRQRRTQCGRLVGTGYEKCGGVGGFEGSGGIRVRRPGGRKSPARFRGRAPVADDKTDKRTPITTRRLTVQRLVRKYPLTIRPNIGRLGLYSLYLCCLIHTVSSV